VINQPKRWITLALLASLLFVLAGCWSGGGKTRIQAAQPVSNSPISPSPTPTPAPTLARPAPGEAAIQGKLIVTGTQQPLSETVFYLTPGIGEQGDEPPVALGAIQAQDIQGRTEMDGSFVLTDVPPGNYYMVIWAPLNWSILPEPDQDETPRLLELEAGQTLNLGEMVIIWP
jgi:hypothetical protein